MLKFAGDALICMFTAENFQLTPVDSSSSSAKGFLEFIEETPNENADNPNPSAKKVTIQIPEELPAKQPAIDEFSPRSLALAAVQCAKDIQESLGEYDSNQGFKLSLHVGIGVGAVTAFHVGGVDNAWEFFVAGDALVQLKTAVDNSDSGEVVVSQQTWDLIAACCTGDERGSDWFAFSIETTKKERRRTRDLSISRALYLLRVCVCVCVCVCVWRGLAYVHLYIQDVMIDDKLQIDRIQGSACCK